MFRIGVYFTEYLLAVGIGGEKNASRDFTFEDKRQEALEEKLNCEFIRNNTSNEIMKLVE